MSGTGKSAVGNILADSLSWRFVDTDRLMEEEQNKPLQSILDELGDERFIQAESLKIGEFSRTEHSVLAPGGSAVYSTDTMKLLKEISTVIYLHSESETIAQRINPESRGIVGLKSKSFKELYTERESLYKRFSDVIVDTEEKTPEEISKEILSLVRI